MPKIALISLGCSKNLVDSEVMLGYLRKSGYSLVSRQNEADIIIVNTCGFIQAAQKEAHGVITDALSRKRQKADLKVYITGCYVERDKERLEKEYPQVDGWLGVKDFDKIVQEIHGEDFNTSGKTFLYDHESPRLVSTSPVWAYMKISEGCSHRCTFCSIPLIKGPYRSRTISSVIEEAQLLEAAGIREVILVSQDSTSFGRDSGIRNGLSALLKSLIEETGIPWIRVLYGYPEEITDGLLETMKDTRICSYMDIPFQHSHPKIIRTMKRGLDGGKALALLEKIRKDIPDVAVRTSLIVGFPGEGEEEFLHLCNFVREARIDHLGVFIYSREKGTDGYALQDSVGERTKQARRDRIMEIQASVSLENQKKYLHRKLEVILEHPAEEGSPLWIARTRYQSPEVDGITLVDTHTRKNLIRSPLRTVEITDCDVYDLKGVIVS